MSKPAKATHATSTGAPTLVPAIRFPEFRNAPEWREDTLANIINTITPPEKLQTSEYNSSGRFPIIDQSPNEQAGWTDNELALISTPLPLIVFGDHTCNLKIARRPFVQGADGIKIFYGKPCALTEYLFQHLQYDPVKMEEYKRHFSILKEKKIRFPDVETGEQQKIADCLSSLDELIAAEVSKVETLKAHKKGLMQQLFPAEGQTIPALRFPEFRDAGEWHADKLGIKCDLYQPETLSASDLNQSGPYDVYGANGIIGKHDSYNHEESEVTVTCRGATCGEVHRTNPRSWITGNAMVVKPRDSDLSKDFIFAFLKFTNLKSVISGSAQPQITRIGFAPLAICYPVDTDEQAKIVDCLSSLDELIAAQASKVEALKAHKKGLMQQLFPTIHEDAA